jgi:cytochrome c-type biogenesis protein CcmH
MSLRSEARRDHPSSSAGKRGWPSQPGEGDGADGSRARVARALLITILLLAGAAPALAVQPDEVLPDPALERRAREISAELRCLVCQNQSIDDSDAPLARDLRVLVRERLKAGDSNQAVRSFVVDRYGEFVLLKPPVGPHTLLLWLTPLLVLAAGGAGIWATVRRRKAVTAPAPLSEAELAALAAISPDRPPRKS